jgi:two-component system response regulator YesN
MRLLIVDDEEQIREGIRRFVISRDMGFEDVDTAENGEQALQKVKIFQPDIILSDVVMPIMNGIHFAQETRKLSKDIKIIMISGHNDFEFARSALKFDACDYILKPIDLDELCNVLSTVILACNQERRERALQDEGLEVVRERFLRPFVVGEETDPQEVSRRLALLQLQMDVQQSYRVAYCVSEGNAGFDQGRTVPGLALLTRLKKEGLSTPHVCFLFDERTVVILSPAHEPWDFLQRVMEDPTIYSSVVVGVGESSVDLYDIPRVFGQARTAAAQRFLRQENGWILYQNIAEKLRTKVEELSLSIQESLRLLQANDIATLKQLLSGQLVCWRGLPGVSLQAIHSMKLELAAYFHKLSREVNGKLGSPSYQFHSVDILEQDTLQQIENWICSQFEMVGERLGKSGGKQHKRLVEMMKTAADTQYMEPFGIQQLSERMGYSPNYLSALFKQEVGVNFTEYVTKLRIDKAKQLMENPSLKLYEICSMVGYEDENYFSRVFRKYNGMSPSEFREGLL